MRLHVQECCVRWHPRTVIALLLYAHARYDNVRVRVYRVDEARSAAQWEAWGFWLHGV